MKWDIFNVDTNIYSILAHNGISIAVLVYLYFLDRNVKALKNRIERLEEFFVRFLVNYTKKEEK